MREPGTDDLVGTLLRIAALGGRHQATHDAVGQVLQDAGLVPASASSLRRMRNGGTPPTGPAEAVRDALADLAAGSAEAEQLARSIVHRFPATRPPRKPAVRSQPRAPRHPLLQQDVEHDARRLMSDVDDAGVRVGLPPLSVRSLARRAQVGTSMAADALDGRRALSPQAFETVLAAVAERSDDGGRQVHLLAAEYERLFGSLRPWSRTALDVRFPAPVTATAGPAEQIRLLHERNLMTADVVLDHDTDRVRLSEVYIRRPAIERALDTACTGPGTTVLVGESGSGKTSALWRMVVDRVERREPVRFLRATDLIAGPLGGEPAATAAAVRTALHEASLARMPILVVDTIDLLLREGEVPPALLAVFDAADSASAAVVLSCRPREAELLRASGLPMTVLRLGLFDDDEMDRAIAAHAGRFDGSGAGLGSGIRDAVSRGLPLVDICRRPLTLRMLFEVLHSGGPATPTDVTVEIDVTDLYDRYWALRVQDDIRGGSPTRPEVDATPSAELVAVLMLALGQPVTADADVDRELSSRTRDATALRTGLPVLRRRGVLDGHGQHDQIEFFHQSFFEYAAARAVWALRPDAVGAVIDRVHRRPSDLFLAAVAQQLLVYAASVPLGTDEIDHHVAGLLTSSDPDVLQLAVSVYGQSRHRGPMARTAAGKLLGSARSPFVRRYLQYLPRVRHDDVDGLVTELETTWQRHDLSTDARVDLLAVLTAVAARSGAGPVVAAAVRRMAVHHWHAGLGPAEARRVLKGPLSVLAAVAEYDRPPVTTALLQVGRTVAGGPKNQDAPAEVIGVAARVVDVNDLDDFVALSPDTVRLDSSGIVELRRSLAGVAHRRLRAEGGDLAGAVAAVIGPSHVDDTDDTSDSADVPEPHAERLRRQVRLLAVAEQLVATDDAETADSVLDALLGCRLPRVQSDVADVLLRHLIDSDQARPLPGSPGRGSTGRVRDLVWRRCRAALDRLPRPGRDRDGGRDVALLWRDALDHARLPPERLDALMGTAPCPAAALADPNRWAALTVGLAAAGRPEAVRVLTEWGDGSHRDGPDGATLRRIYTRRMIQLVPDHPALLEHLVRDAETEADATHIVNAILQPDGGRRPDLGSLADRVGRIAWSRTGSAAPKARAAGYRLLGVVGTDSAKDDGLIHSVETERSPDVNGAMLDLVLAIVRNTPHEHWPTNRVRRFDAALRARSVATDDPDRRCTDIRRELHCRHGPVGTVADRTATVDLVADLMSSATGQKSFSPVGWLVSRLEEVDRAVAARVLVDASIRMHALPDHDAWKNRTAHQWRAGILGLVERLSPTAWEDLVTELAAANPHVLAQVVDAGVALRDAASTERLRAVLDRADAGEEVRTALRNAGMRRQRLHGGGERWTRVLELWAAAHTR